MEKIIDTKSEEIENLFWKSTQEKITILRDNSILWLKSEEEEEFIIHAYYYFLHIDHMMQKRFIKQKESIIYDVKSNNEKKEFYEILERFNSLIENKL